MSAPSKEASVSSLKSDTDSKKRDREDEMNKPTVANGLAKLGAVNSVSSALSSLMGRAK
jgi:hypothetical protein